LFILTHVESKKTALKECKMTDRLSEKNGIVCLILCFFLGVFGAHRFYVGKYRTAILTLVTLGAIGLWPLIDLLMILMGKFTDAHGKPIKPIL
jgi:TM2 domain-containing membrane protein YozV